MRVLLLALLVACHPDPSGPTEAVDADGDGHAASVDCDDARGDVYPDAPEACDGADNDCDGDVDEAAADAVTYFADADGDGHGDAAASLAACDAPAGYVTPGDDCDDADASSYPGHGETCDDVDNDCNGAVDDAPSDPGRYYADDDADGYGDPALSLTSCDAPDGYVEDATDCDDANPAVHPDAPEPDCDDPVDYNCDGSVMYADGDGDGVPACEDCDDTRADRSPRLTEICDDADLDEDCDGSADDTDADTDATSMSTWSRDADGDAYGAVSGLTRTQCESPIGFALATGDCDDADPLVNPLATEVCDGADVDEDCDGLVDDADPTTDPSSWSAWYRDADRDGYGDPARGTSQCDAPANYVADSTDCDDADATRSPGAAEVCDAADIDEDCDGLTDDEDADATGAVAWYTDADGDGYGDAAASRSACDPGAAEVAVAGDCDDARSGVHPGAVEVCDAADTDEDCSGAADDADAGTDPDSLQRYYPDADSDGHGASAGEVGRCDRPAGYVDAGDDCDDADAHTFPGAASSDSPTACMTDVDGDGFGDAAAPSGVTSGADCDDSDAAVSPAALETCGTAGDDDCDGTANDPGATGCVAWYYDGDGDGYGLLTASYCACDASGAYRVAGVTSADDDCDDAQSGTNPGATELCDAADVDEDCDGLADDADSTAAASGKRTVYADVDGDGYGAGAAFSACDVGAGYAAVDGDCDDARPTVRPDATESCASAYDDDCDGDVNEVGAAGCVVYYYDADRDGYGVAADSQCACAATGGYDSALATDCDDGAPASHPGAPEVCDDSGDNDCDGTVDDGCRTHGYSGDYEADYPSTGATHADAVIRGESSASLFGATLVTGIDLDGDGYDNTVVGSTGATYSSGSTTYHGGVYVYDGFPTGTSDALAADVAHLYGGSSSSSLLPVAMWPLADFDSDGRDELAVYTTASATEYVYIYEGEDLTGTASASGTPLFSSFALTGPVAGLGHTRSLTGNPTVGMANYESASSQGAVYVYGYATTTLSKLNTIVGEDVGDYAGHGLAGGDGNDPNGDGYDDIFVGSYGDDDGGSGAGAAYVVEAPLASTTYLYSAGVKIAGSSTNDQFGYLVGAPGDMDGDGQADMLVTAPQDDDGGTNAGVVFVFEDVDPDSAASDNDAGDFEVKILGAQSGDALGTVLPAWGDVDGDGTLDLLLSSPAADRGTASSAGAAWLLYGPLAGTYDLASTSDYDARFLGDGGSDGCGSAVGIGDLDADGFDDLLLGCTYGDSGAYADYGALYVFAGI